MKMQAYFIKTLKENVRDWKLLVMTVAVAPMFVYLMYAYMNGSGASTSTVAVVNLDSGGAFSGELIERWRGVADAKGKAILVIAPMPDTASGRKAIRNRSADLLMTIPSDFSISFSKYLYERKGSVSALESFGDPANSRYVMAASFCDYTTLGYVSEKTGVEMPLNIKFESAGGDRPQRDFDLFFPAFLGIAVIMILFTAGGTLVREVEKGTMARLIVSRLAPFELLGAVALSQVIIGILCLVFTYVAGLTLGYRSNGSLGLLLLVGAAACFSVVAISILTACFVRTLFGLLTVGSFPWFILTFFSDCFMTLPKYRVASLWGNPLYLNDILPTALATRAYNKILTHNAYFPDISFELFAIIALSALYFVIGAALFKRIHMSVG